MKAQMGLPDMKLPIQYALAYPQRLKTDFPRFNFAKYPSLTFEQPDMETLPCLNLAMEALKKGGNMPCVLNAANEIAVAAFLKDAITFTDISRIIETCMEKVGYIAEPGLEDYVLTDKETRRNALNDVSSQPFKIN
jgi:1-deoxy-D-xylulose-5-phosphate reductoisomerase